MSTIAALLSDWDSPVKLAIALDKAVIKKGPSPQTMMVTVDQTDIPYTRFIEAVEVYKALDRPTYLVLARKVKSLVDRSHYRPSCFAECCGTAEYQILRDGDPSRESALELLGIYKKGKPI